MGKGEVFGDKAITEDAPRSATILAKTDIVCIILCKKDF